MATNLGKALRPLMIASGPRYINKFFYSLGFLSAISFMMLLVSGVIMSVFGPNWWLTSSIGKFLRSVHLWSTQAFVIFIILHILVVFFSSGFKKPRRFTWVLGVFMLLFVLAETEFGYVLRGDYSSQWRSLQGADFYNGSGLGYWLNALNSKQIYGMHIVVIPLLILGLLSMHYLLVRFLGIAKPYRKEVQVANVPANHTLLFARGGVLVVVIVILAVILPSPYLKPVSIKEIATDSPQLMASTLASELAGTSDTATYVDNIAPYTYSTANIYLYAPYAQLASAGRIIVNQSNKFQKESAAVQAAQVKAATDYFSTWNGTFTTDQTNPAVVMINQLVVMAQSGLYEPSIAAQNQDAKPGDDSTYVLRFLSDSGVLETKATGLNLTTDQYGMLHEEGGKGPGAWWLAPIGLLNHSALKNDDNGDRDAGIIFGSFFLVLLAFPFIPVVNRLPEFLKVYKLIWHEPRSK